MVYTRNVLIEQLRGYTTTHGEERPFVPAFLNLLSHPDCFLRTHLPGHITGSAWIVDKQRSHVLLVQHAKLKKWLQPGGHADGDENVLQVAMRETEEETGLSNIRLIHTGIFDIDVHPIPARKDFTEHLHFDIRFLLEANREDKITISEESTDVRWIPLADLDAFNEERSVIRMKEKVNEFVT